MIQGKRVVLRALERGDLPRLHQFNNDLAVEVAGVGDPPMPQSLARMEAEFDKQSSEGGRSGNNFVIEVDGVCVGICGLFNEDKWAHHAEMGITIGDKGFWGKGYGREAVKLLLYYAFHHHNLRRVYLRVGGNNERAMRAYKACGFAEEGRLREQVWNDGRYVDQVWMGVMREEWLDSEMVE